MCIFSPHLCRSVATLTVLFLEVCQYFYARQYFDEADKETISRAAKRMYNCELIFQQPYLTDLKLFCVHLHVYNFIVSSIQQQL